MTFLIRRNEFYIVVQYGIEIRQLFSSLVMIMLSVNAYHGLFKWDQPASCKKLPDASVLMTS